MTLATQGANGTVAAGSTASTTIVNEMRVLMDSIDKIQSRTKFSGVTLLNGAAITIASSNVASDTIVIDATALGLIGSSSNNSAATLSGQITTSSTSYTLIQSYAATYITSLDTQRGKLGALQNQMEYAVNNITELSANLSAARSRVMDTDYATETAQLTKGQILQQAATAMLAQANQMPNVILTLLK
jgi:flagellin